ncbi:C-type lectin BML-2-like [Ceratitis capitata]|uniref:C-type lectin BML-2-like n=1 Tax=Ceratitis capitata TaxID=7213 RepID=UPI000329DF8E|nr:C-type lectin BML-2-like [Ceratitis capitata]
MFQLKRHAFVLACIIVIGSNHYVAALVGPSFGRPVPTRERATSTTTLATTLSPTTTTEASNVHNHPKFYVSENQLNWFGATVYCQELNWRLIALDSAEITVEFEEFLTKFNLRNRACWTAGNQLTDMKTWRWELGGKPLNYTHWAPHQPDNYKNRQHCIALFAKSLQWDDDFCESAHYFACLKN